MRKRIKNYTSTVPVSVTVSRIESALADAGASGITKDYKEGQLMALCFKIELPVQKQEVVIRLPVKADAVYNALRKQCKRLRRGTEVRLHEQAQRTAWKVMQDWLEVQLTLIHLEQVDALEVFLSHVWDGQQTFFAKLKQGRYKDLPLLTQ